MQGEERGCFEVPVMMVPETFSSTFNPCLARCAGGAILFVPPDVTDIVIHVDAVKLVSYGLTIATCP